MFVYRRVTIENKYLEILEIPNEKCQVSSVPEPDLSAAEDVVKDFEEPFKPIKTQPGNSVPDIIGVTHL